MSLSQLMEDFAEAMSNGTAEEAQEIMMRVRDNARRVGGRMSAELLTIPMDMEEEQEDENSNQSINNNEPIEDDISNESVMEEVEKLFENEDILEHIKAMSRRTGRDTLFHPFLLRQARANARRNQSSEPSEPSRAYMAEGNVEYYRENHTRNIERVSLGRYIDEDTEVETTDSSEESINIGEVELTHEGEMIFDKIDWTPRHKEVSNKEDRIIEY